MTVPIKIARAKGSSNIQKRTIYEIHRAIDDYVAGKTSDASMKRIMQIVGRDK